MVSNEGAAAFRHGVTTRFSRTFILAEMSEIAVSPLSIHICLVVDVPTYATMKAFVMKMRALRAPSFFVVIDVHFPPKDVILDTQNTRLLSHIF
jgi:hypothetical protein